MATALRNSYITRSTTPTQTGVVVTAGDIILVFIGGGSTSNETSSCADNASGGSNTYTKETSGAYAHIFINAAEIIDVFSAKAKASETLTITVTTTCTNIDDIGVQVISGAAASAYVESIAYKDCTSSPATSFTGASITTTNPGDFLACFWDADYSGVTYTENGAGFTIDKQTVTGVNSYRVTTSTGTYADALTTNASQKVACVMVAIKAAATALTPTTGTLSLAGQTPTLTQTLVPAAGAVTLAGQTPSLTKILTPTGVVSTATNEPFAPSGTTGQMTIGGVPVVSGASISSLVRTDWQGAVALSASARTNRLTYSADPSSWTKRGTCTATTDGAGTGPDGVLASWTIAGLNTGSNDIYLYRAAGFLVGRFEPLIFIKPISTSGVLTLTNPSSGSTGGNWRVDLSLLTAGVWNKVDRTHPSVTIATEFSSTDATGGLQVVKYSGTGTLSFHWGVAQLESATACGSFIYTTTAPQAITDMAVTNSGSVTLGQTASGTYALSGTGVLASLSLAGGVPSLTNVITPAQGTVSLAGGSPSLTKTLVPASGSLALAGMAATLLMGLTPTPGTLTLTGNVPSISIITVLTPVAGSVVLTGNTPTLTTTLAPGAGSISLAGGVPSLTKGLSPTPGAITLAGQTPTLAVTAVRFHSLVLPPRTLKIVLPAPPRTLKIVLPARTLVLTVPKP